MEITHQPSHRLLIPGPQRVIYSTTVIHLCTIDLTDFLPEYIDFLKYVSMRVQFHLILIVWKESTRSPSIHTSMCIMSLNVTDLIWRLGGSCIHRRGNKSNRC